MELLEEMLYCRDRYERFGIHNQSLNENIDKIIKEGMKKRRV